MNTFIKTTLAFLVFGAMVISGAAAFASNSSDGGDSRESLMCIAESSAPQFLTCDDAKMLLGK